MLIKSLCYIKENVNKEPFYTQCLYTVTRGKCNEPERLYSVSNTRRYCGETPIPAVFVQETITQHTSRMASNDTTRYGYKLGLYDNEKKNLYEC